MIIFERSMIAGYAARTVANAMAADLTLAVAADFSTAGERLTRQAALEEGKLYLPVKVGRGQLTPIQVFRELNSMKGDVSIETINFAGNGLYTLIKHGWNQEMCDQYAYDLLKCIYAFLPIRSVRSGGQTGFDEAGLKAADLLGIKAICHAPKNWAFRTVLGTDITGDEDMFKVRFDICKIRT